MTGTRKLKFKRTSRRTSKSWIAALIGFAVLLSACFGGGSADALITTAPTPEPMYEPANAVGNNPFASVVEQSAEANSARVMLALAEAEASGIDPMSAIAQVNLTLPSEDEEKSGLYGGTLENTCNAERLIKHLLDNPTQGQVWADVQGIAFVEIPDFINSLTPAVLEQDVTVLNHGYDPKGHAIPIVSTLQAGTAVFLDDKGDVRVRCYCGNPILPYVPTTYEPPQCLTFFAIVYTSPSDRKTVENVPRSVRATNQISSHEGVEWKEVKWGNGSGWVRADESETRYCKPADKIDCVSYGQITQRPGSGDYIGEVETGYVSVVAPNLEGWALIKFAETSGWVEASTLGSTDCTYDVQCVSVSSGTWSRPAFAGNEIVRSSQSVNVEYSGHSFTDGTGTYDQVYVTHPSPTRVGYINRSDVQTLSASDCQVGEYCSLFDIDVNVYQESSGTATWGVLWFAEVQLLSSQPTNGRYQIDWGNGTGWVDIGDLHGQVYGHPCQTVSCIQSYTTAYDPLPDQSSTRGLPSSPFVATFTGKVHYVGNDTYREFTSPAVAGGPAWIEASVGYYPRDWADCEVPPVCYPEFDVCEIECIAKYSEEGYWAVQARWTPSGRALDISFNWPAGWTGLVFPPGQLSGVTDIGTGPFALTSAVTVDWRDTHTGFTGSAECHVDLCDYIDFDGDLGYLGDLERPNPESCIELSCTAERSFDGIIPNDIVTVSWTPANAQLSTLNVDFPLPAPPISRTGVTSAQTFTQPVQGPAGNVLVTWTGPDAQSGVAVCNLSGECDVFDYAFPTTASKDCCPEPSRFIDSTGECCPSERLTRGGCCPEGTVTLPADGCGPICDGVTLSNGECCPTVRAVGTQGCCTDGLIARDGDCVEVDAEDPVPTATPGPTSTPEPTATPRPGPTPTPRPTATPSPTPTRTPGCPAGFSAIDRTSGRVCTRQVDAIETVSNTGSTCPAGYEPDGFLCSRTVTEQEAPLINETTTCPVGSIDTGGSCVRELLVDVQVEPIATDGPYSCPPGTDATGGSGAGLQCEQFGPAPTCPGELTGQGVCSTSFICPAGYVLAGFPGSSLGLQCRSASGPDLRAPVSSSTLSCPGNAITAEPPCFIQESQTETVDYIVSTSTECRSGFTSSGDVCVRQDTDTVDPTSTSTRVWTCPAGATGNPSADVPFCVEDRDLS